MILLSNVYDDLGLVIGQKWRNQPSPIPKSWNLFCLQVLLPKTVANLEIKKLTWKKENYDTNIFLQ